MKSDEDESGALEDEMLESITTESTNLNGVSAHMKVITLGGGGLHTPLFVYVESPFRMFMVSPRLLIEMILSIVHSPEQHPLISYSSFCGSDDESLQARSHRETAIR